MSTKKIIKPSTHLGTIFCIVLSALAAFLLILTLGYFYQACDIGINAAANSMFLVYLVLPGSLLIFIITSIVSFLVLRNFALFKKKGYLIYLIVTFIVIIVFLLALGVEFWRLRDYPTRYDIPGDDRNVISRCLL